MNVMVRDPHTFGHIAYNFSSGGEILMHAIENINFINVGFFGKEL